MSRRLDTLLNKFTLGDGPKPQIDMTKGGQGWVPWQAALYPGSKLFELKATHGLPLDIAVDRVINLEKLRIEWPSFIETARKNGWWDYMTIEAMEVALTDADVNRILRDEIIISAKMYMLANPIDIATALVAKGDSNDR
jgi:hypothetical protein